MCRYQIEKQRRYVLKNRKIYIICLVILLIFSGTSCSKKKENELIDTIKGYKGYIRTIEEEEYRLYEYLVGRDIHNEVSEEELRQQVENYANEINAIFYLGNQLGLCEPYSYELLQIRMEQENDIRRIKKENGEAIYGLEKFNIETYFQYTVDNIEIKIVDYLLQNVDETIENDAEHFYKRHRSLFTTRESVTYEQIINGDRTEKIADRDELNFMGKSDMSLADFLETSNIGGHMYLKSENEEKSYTILDIEYSELDFDENKTFVINHYIRAELYPELIKTVAKNNPIELKLNE